MITVMVLLQWAVAPLICATTVDTAPWAGFLCFVVVFSYWSINYIATELEMPFGDDLNDLPMYNMQRDFNKSFVSMMDEAALDPCLFQFIQETHQLLHPRTVDLDGDG